MNPPAMGQRQPISGQERRLVWAVIVAILTLTSLPYLYGYASSPPDRQFMGLMLNVPDHTQYLSWWRSFQSSVLIRNKLTPEPNAPIFFNLLWWTLAQVSRSTGLGYAAVYQIFRWVAGASFLWAAYRLLARLLQQRHRRCTAFLLVTLSSGLGWVLVVLKHTVMKGQLLFPLDIYVAEGNSFLCILGYPHFAFAGTFILLTLEFFWRGWKEARTRYMVAAGLVALLLGWQHAYDLLLVYGITGAFVLLMWLKRRVFPWRLFWGSVIIFSLSCSGAIYSVILTTVDPVWQQVLAQFDNAGVYTPSPPHLAILFGPPLILAVGTSVGLAWRKQWSEENLFVMGWFLANAVLNYVPTDFQIHMLNTWQVPMMILATKGLYGLAMPRLGSGKLAAARLLTAASVVAVMPTNVYLYAWRFVDLHRHDYPYYLHRDEVAALNWLEDSTEPDDVVLSSLTIGQYIPAVSGNTAFLAHWAQTVDFYDKRDRVARFFDAATKDAERAETLRTFGVDYVLHGPAERELGMYDPSVTPWLALDFSTPRVKVYSVQAEKLAAMARLVDAKGW